MRRSLLRTVVVAAFLTASASAGPLVLDAAVSTIQPADAASGQPWTSMSKPPMGWDYWLTEGCAKDNPYPGSVGPSQDLIHAQADAMVKDGLTGAGYNLVLTDDCWMAPSRTTDGHLQADPVKFKDGMASLGNYLHNDGLKYGIYEDVGLNTCAVNPATGQPLYPGSFGHYQTDANDFAQWGADYVKLDGCHVAPGHSTLTAMTSDYAAFASAMQSSGRTMAYSASLPAYFSKAYGTLGTKSPDSTWFQSIDNASQLAQVYRVGRDAASSNNPTISGSHWDYVDAHGQHYAVMGTYGYMWPLSRFSGPGNYADPDFISPGDHLTGDESRSQFALWSMMSSPLILGVDVTALSSDMLTMLKNQDVINIDQDPLGHAATMVSQDGNVDILRKDLSNGDEAVAFLNHSGAAQTPSATLSTLGYGDAAGSTCSASVKNLWAGTTSTVTGGSASSLTPGSVASHATAIYRITPTSGCTSAHRGQITNANGKCLTAPAALGSAVTLATCTGAATQLWTVDASAMTISTSGGCLEAQQNLGQYALWRACDGDFEQQWNYQRQGQLRSRIFTDGCLYNTYTTSCTDGYDSEYWSMPTRAFGTTFVDAPTLSFGNVPVNTTSPVQSSTMFDYSQQVVTVASVASDNPAFALSPDSPCKPGAAVIGDDLTYLCPFQFVVTPTATGALTAHVVISFTDDTAPLSLTLTATGVTPNVTASSGLSFGSVAKGSTTTTKTITLKNSGTAATTFNGVSWPDSVFVQKIPTTGTACTTGLVLAASGGSCTLAFSATPSAAQVYADALDVKLSNTSDLKVAMSVTGLGPNVTLDNSSVTLDAAAIGQTSAPSIITVTNTGTSEADFSGMSLTGSSVFDFRDWTSCSATTVLAPGGWCEIVLEATPTTAGTFTGTVNLTFSNAPAMTVAASETGLDPTKIDDAASGVTYAGAWTASTGLASTTWYQGTSHTTAVPASSTFGFTSTVTASYTCTSCTRLTWIGSSGPDHGIAAVSIDGAIWQSYQVDAYAATLTGPSTLFMSTLLTLGKHTITVYAQNWTDPYSTGDKIDIDAFGYSTSTAPGGVNAPPGFG